MINQFTEWILLSLRDHGAWSVFIGVLVEQIIIPIPSPTIIMGAGMVLVPPDAAWDPAIRIITDQIVLPGTSASIMGALMLYYVGFWGGRVFVEKFHRYLGFNWGEVQSLGRRMEGWGTAASLFFLRALPVVPLSLISVVAGVFRIPVGPFLIWSLLGTLVRCFILGILGWQLGGQALNWSRGVNRFESLISLALVAAAIGIILYLRARVRKAARP